MGHTLEQLTRSERERLKVAELSADERAAVHLLQSDRFLRVSQLAAALGVTPARAGELVESIRAKAMSNRQRRRGRRPGRPARHRRLQAARREAER